MAEMSHTDTEAQAEVEVLTQANSTDSRPVYEVGFHVVPTVDEARVGEVFELVRTELAKHNAEIIKEQFPQKLVLAYTVERAAAGKREKFTESYFGFIKFAVDRDAVASLEVLVRSTNDILRYLLIETTREETVVMRRAVYSSNRLEGETIKKPESTPETPTEVSEEDLQKSIDALVS